MPIRFSILRSLQLFARSATSSRQGGWRRSLAFWLVASGLMQAAGTASAQVVSVTGGTLVMNIDGNAFANGADTAYLAGLGVNLTPGQTFMEFARHFTPVETVGLGVTDFRPAANPPVVNFNDLRATWVRPPSTGLQFEINGTAPIPNQPAGRNAQPTSFAFNPANITGTASGLIGTVGTSSYWYANQAMIDTGSIWLAYGDLSLQYSAARATGGNSGWFFTNHMLFDQELFDTRNVSVDFSNNILSISGDLVVSQEFRDGYALQSGLNVGSFQLSGTAVPEPTSILLLGGVASASGLIRRLRRRTARS